LVVNLSYRLYGSGVPLLILHGLFGSGTNWRSVATQLGANFSVYTIDLRNHGESSWSAEMNYPAMAEDVREFIEAHGLGAVHILGHSMGGKVAMEFTARYPGHVKRLVVVDITPRKYGGDHDEILEAMRSIDPAIAPSRSSIDASLAGKVPDSAVRAFLLTNLKRQESGGYHWKINLEAIRDQYKNLTEAVAVNARVDKPVLFILGGRSSYVSEEDRARIRKVFIDAEFVTIRHAGHWVHADAPDEFVAHIRSFLT
jgi:pimeloyl-ACP methyl ester carboxylesterase